MEEYRYYWSDPLKSSFEVTVGLITNVDRQKLVEIKEPVIKPSGGGQAGDRGSIVIDGKSFHFFDTAFQDGKSFLVMEDAPDRGGKAILSVDMEWRMNMMRNHTAEHLFVGLLKSKYPHIALGRIWIDGNHGTITLHGVDLSVEDILDSEENVQKLIEDGIDVATRIVSANEMDESIRVREGVTSKHDVIRVVKIGDVDSSACSGIHVTNTSEIHVFKVIDIKKQDNETYLEFLTGKSAFNLITRLFNTALIRKHSYPFEYEQLGAVLDKSKNLQKSYNFALQKIVELMDIGPRKEDIGSIEFWYDVFPGFDMNTLRGFLRQLKIEKASIVLFLAPGRKTNLLLWTHKTERDAAHYIQDVVADLGGRGGGSKDAFTGGFTDVENPTSLCQVIVDHVREKIQTQYSDLVKK